MDLDLKINKSISDKININISLNELCTDGGVYMFLIDDIPLYIGEANIFLSRLSYHLYNLKNLSYFGLATLEKKHNITYVILKSGLPYKKIKKEGEKAKDGNKSKRKKLEKKYIDKYNPLIQKPIHNIVKGEKYKTRSDHIITCINTKNKIVKLVLESDKKIMYNDIIKEIKEKYENL